MERKIFKKIAFDNMLNHSSVMAYVEYQRVMMLERKGMILVTAREFAYVDFDWRESSVNLLLNKKTLSLIKVFRNWTMDPTHVLSSVRNDVIVYFKKDSFKLEFVHTNGGFKLKTAQFPFKIVDIAFHPLIESKILLVSDRSVFSFDYRTEELDIVFTAEEPLTHIAAKPQESTLKAIGSDSLFFISLDEKKLIKTGPLENQTPQKGTLKQDFELMVLEDEEERACDGKIPEFCENQVANRESTSTAATDSLIEAELEQSIVYENLLENEQNLEVKHDYSWYSLRDKKWLFRLQNEGKFEISMLEKINVSEHKMIAE